MKILEAEGAEDKEVKQNRYKNRQIPQKQTIEKEEGKERIELL